MRCKKNCLKRLYHFGISAVAAKLMSSKQAAVYDIFHRETKHHFLEKEQGKRIVVDNKQST
jgi:hypothetical protein